MNDSAQNFDLFLAAHSNNLLHSSNFPIKFMISKFIKFLNFNETIQYLFEIPSFSLHSQLVTHDPHHFYFLSLHLLSLSHL